MYDFMVFGYYAATIGRTFFPGGSEYASLMKSLMTFAAGYLMRPLGAILLGSYIDRHGRRKGLLLTLSLMAAGTLSVACMPSYAVIGLIAPSLILLGRLVQGLSAGAQLGGVSVYLAEIAAPGQKGFLVAWQSASQQVAVMLAAVIGIILSFTLTAGDMDRWGWRIPLFVGCAIIPLLFVLRNSLEETEDFATRKHHPALPEILRSLATNWKVVTLGTMLATLTTVGFYLITAYAPTFGGLTLHLKNSGVQIVLLCVGLSNFFWLPVMGALSDRVGRIKALLTFSTLTLLTAYPTLLWLVARPSFARLLAAELWISFLYGGYNGTLVVYLVEIMPASARTAGFSLAYSLATAVFGGFTPAICTWLIAITGNKAVPGLWLSFAASIALIAALLMARTGRPAPVPRPMEVAVKQPM
jgi:MFS family permease